MKTREQQMMEAADRHADEVCDESCTGAHVAETINDFCAGWRAADSHPQWIPVEEELPKHKVEDNGLITYEEVLVCLNDGYETTDCYDDASKKWLGYNGDVEYWMPLPVPPLPSQFSPNIIVAFGQKFNILRLCYKTLFTIGKEE